MNIRALLGLVPALTAIAALAQVPHDRHVLFDNSLPDGSWFHSLGNVVAPSRLERVDGRFPVAPDRFVSPPNSLRLAWTSAPGGDWRMTLRIPERYGRKFEFDGDTLAFWCWSEDELHPANTPRISLQDAAGVSSPTIDLVPPGARMPARQWVRWELPFSRFVMAFEPTDDTRFDPRRLVAVSFVQGLDDGRTHRLFLDDFRVIEGGAKDTEPPRAPSDLQVTAGERHFDLRWKAGPDPDRFGYRIYRSTARERFVPVGIQRGDRNRYVDFVGAPPRRASYRVTAVDLAGNESRPAVSGEARTRRFSDEELLDQVQEGCFRYYWDAAHPEAGIALEILPGDPNLVAVGGSGHGIGALLVGAERGFVTREQAVERLLRIVRFLSRADRFHGVWPHFLDGRTGKAVAFFGKYDNGGDLVETAFLVQGLLAARQYFDREDAGEREIRDTITRLWGEVEWDWYRKTPDSDVLYWHWSPDHGFHISHPLIGWNETLIVYLLAIASPTHGVPAELYHSGWAGRTERHVRYRQGWGRTTDGDHYTNGRSYFGIPLGVGVGNGGELFFTQFSFLGFDPQGMRDPYANYFENNRAIARINHAYCVENPRRRAGYGPACWGLSAGIRSGGGRPLPRDDNGTINISAALGSFPYTPRESLAALKHFYRELGAKTWGIYGFHDGFNQTENWFEEVYMALNQAPIVVMIENHRSGLVWKRFMANPEIRPALERIGFRADPR